MFINWYVVVWAIKSVLTFMTKAIAGTDKFPLRKSLYTLTEYLIPNS